MIEERELLNGNIKPNLSNSKSNLNNDKNNKDNINHSKNNVPIVFRLKFNFVVILILHYLFKILDFQFFLENEEKCENKDPMWKFHERVENEADYLCKSRYSVHFCYKNPQNNYQLNKGVVCTMSNFTLDPSKWQKDDINLEEQNNYRNIPLISNGFFNIKCETEKKYSDYNKIYDYYFNSWNYTLINYNNNIINEEQYEEFAPEKIVFLINRNYDSQNLFKSFVGFLNAFSLMKIYCLNPEDIQIIFLESVPIENDPYYDLYKELISRGGKPIHVSTLTKKYQISNAINIPLNYDSPYFAFPEMPKCKKQTKTFELLNKSIKQYMKIGLLTYFPDYNKNIIYYPKNLNSNFSVYNKFVTIQWIKENPKDKKGQKNILGNGHELVEALSEQLPKNILVRLVDISLLNIRGKISLMKKTDFFITESTEGLFLSIFLPPNAIVQEISNKKSDNNIFQLMSRLSGHVTYSNIINTNVKMINDNEVLYYDVKKFVKVILAHMKKNNFNN